MLGTGISINNKINDLQKIHEKLNFFTWGHSFKFCVEKLGFYPEYVSFIDWHSMLAGLDIILKNRKKISTILYLFTPILNNDYATQLKFIGTSQDIKTNKTYQECIKKLKNAEEYMIIKEIPSSSTKYLSTKQKVNVNELFLNNNTVVINNLLHQGEDKLYSTILPLLVYLKFTQVYCVGFEGIGPRYMTNKPRNKNLARIQQVRKDHMHLWLKQSNLKIFSLDNSPHNYFPTITTSELCQKY
jgi:hypothetical protein